MTPHRRILAALAAVALTLNTAACKPCDVAAETEAYADTVVAPAMSVLLPVLGPEMQAKYALLKGALDLSRKALKAALCSKSTDRRERAMAATQSAIDLIEFFQDLTASREISETALRSRGYAMPRGAFDAGLVLARAGGGKPRSIDSAALLAKLKAVRTDLEVR